jgi:hypothetical protein
LSHEPLFWPKFDRTRGWRRCRRRGGSEIHRQQATDPVRFHRQWHGGSAFDTRRGRIVLFGSEIHGDDWTNSPLFFDLASLTWTRAYPDDPPSTYGVTAEGVPVAGVDGRHP